MTYQAPEPPQGILQKIYDLEVENNRMLHAMRRGSMVKTIFRILWWGALLGGSIWLYSTYLGPLLQETLTKVDQVNNSLQAVQTVGTNLSAQTGEISATAGDINALIQKVRAFIPNIPAAQ